MNQQLLHRLDQRIAAKSLLQHPFYQDWTAGKLTLEDLRRYAAQYYHFESTLPTFLSAIHTRCPEREVRQAILVNLWDEEYGEKNHRALWLQFCEALNLTSREVQETDLYPETQNLVDTHRTLTSSGSFTQGLAALYAYEHQVPQIAQKKLEGLNTFYGIEDPQAVEFFSLHSHLDIHHSNAEAEAVVRYTATPGEEAQVEQALDKALDSWWGFLDGVHQRRQEER